MTTELDAGESGATDACAETVRVRVLPESALQQLGGSEAGLSGVLPPGGFDPYCSDLGATATGPTPRRTLDDMRRLSEAIVRNRRQK